jgi:hypothetical protein
LDFQPSRWRKFFIIGGLALLPFAGTVVWLVIASLAADRGLQEEMARAYREDPNWRLEDLENSREVVTDEQNGALVVREAKALVPQRKYDEKLDKLLKDLAPQEQLNREQVQALTQELEEQEEALVEGRRLARYAKGRHPIFWTEDGMSTLVPHVQDVRELATLLGYDALLRAQERPDGDGALASCQAALNAGRSLGDEPLLISLLVRLATRSMALRKLERVLAQTQPSEPALAALQQLLELEEQQPLMLMAARGERALSDRMAEWLQHHRSLQNIKVLEGLTRDGSGQGSDVEMMQLLFAGPLKAQRAALLRYQSRFVEIAKLPVEEQGGRLQELEATARDEPVLVRLFAPAVSRVAEANRLNQAELRCAVLMLAAERFRRARGRWPDAPADLIPAQLVKVPADPYDGAPLRFRRVGDGVVIYSVGPDGKDDGGHLARKMPPGDGTDLGFRLWDVSRRRQPAGQGADKK